MDQNKPRPSDSETDHASINLPENSVLMGMESYASIELGVAKIEIMYQKNLKCIAMTSNGWRCQEIVHEEQLLKARELLRSSVMSEGELDTKLLPQLVLCPGHVLGELPRIYSERWAAFAEQRLNKEEAMSKFNADFWKSVQFFDNARSHEPAFPTHVNIRGNECEFSLPVISPFSFDWTTNARDWDFAENWRRSSNIPTMIGTIEYLLTPPQR
jgi:hypothetical protein